MNVLKIKIARIVTYVILFLGLIISAYLLYRYIKITNDSNRRIADVCSTIFNTGCDTALQSTFSSVFGLPLAAWGIIYYCSIFLLLFIPTLFGMSFKHVSKLIQYLLLLAGVIAAIVLITMMFVYPSMFCPLCTVIHIINTCLFFLLNYSNGFSARQVGPSIMEGISSLFSSKIRLPETRWKIFGLLSCLFLVMSIYFGLKILANSDSRVQLPIVQLKPIYSEFKSQPVMEIPVLDEDPMIGKPNSPIQLVLFSDFFCNACRLFSKDLIYILEEEVGNYNIVFKHFPLSTTCNPTITKNMHPSACDAALASIAAHQQGKFWIYHDALFKDEPGNKTNFYLSLAEKAGLNIDLFEEFIHSEKANAILSRDIQIANQLGIDATPTLYLNGRLIKDMRRGIPQYFINQELKELAVKDSLTRLTKDSLK